MGSAAAARGRLQHRILNVSAADCVTAREGIEINVRGQRRCALGCNCTCQMRPRSGSPGNSNSTCVRMRRSNAGSKLAARLVAKITTPVYRSSSCSSTLTTAVRFALGAAVDGRRSARGDRVGFVEEEDGLLLASGTEDGGHVLRGFAHPHRFQLGIAHNQELTAERPCDGLGADGLARARRPSEIEGKTKPGGVAFPQAPVFEYQLMLGNLGQRNFESVAGRGRQNDIVKGSPWGDAIDRSPAGTTKEAAKMRSAPQAPPYLSRRQKINSLVTRSRGVASNLCAEQAIGAARPAQQVTRKGQRGRQLLPIFCVREGMNTSARRFSHPAIRSAFALGLASSLLLTGCGAKATSAVTTPAPTPTPAPIPTPASSCSTPAVTITHTATAANSPQLVILDKNKYPLALCNDGTAAAYVLRPGAGAAANRWLISLQGGGECYDQASCSSRAATMPTLVSSASYQANPSSAFGQGGLLSPAASSNPDFYDASTVQVLYCSSDDWSGAKSSSTTYSPGDPTTWNFQGRAILDAVIADLSASHAFASATEVMLTGQSAGGVGTFANANPVAKLVPSTARFVAYSDAGFGNGVDNFLATAPPPNYIDTVSTPNQIAKRAPALPLWNGTGDPVCAAASPSDVNSQINCYSGQTLLAANGHHKPSYACLCLTRRHQPARHRRHPQRRHHFGQSLCCRDWLHRLLCLEPENQS